MTYQTGELSLLWPRSQSKSLSDASKPFGFCARTASVCCKVATWRKCFIQSSKEPRGRRLSLSRLCYSKTLENQMSNFERHFLCGACLAKGFPSTAVVDQWIPPHEKIPAQRQPITVAWQPASSLGVERWYCCRYFLQFLVLRHLMSQDDKIFC